jgi:hypothetical protein
MLRILTFARTAPPKARWAKAKKKEGYIPE